ncbi:MAG TPA: TolC family outer membrane protein [Accumulibacter sp.]|uniref:TolC family outer membrane protein n=1 Tax=Accumulibacter sp. TaxID=2053492 RepID=UPI0025E8CF10|nr:TolC family outer membrane protein [Accumulibacter sp.]MCM8599579.1 TolC family outer membrane protein [Accumulibacter sp.]MCM8663480.1 TolC family outer membrane protein [Accumulibacter sp.]HNC51002.1 TolC family outer membrane protein [Accumulibacter sp.]
MGRWQVGLAGCALALCSSIAFSAGLLEAYQAARQNDPTFRAARHERDAGQYNIDISRAGLLPNLSFSGSYSKNTGERQSTIVNVTQQLDYRYTYSVVTLRQPLFNYDSYVRYQQGGVLAAYSDAIFDKKEAELAVKLAGAYFDALLAMEKLALADAEITAYGAQRELAERRRRGGEGTVTEVAEADSRLQLARAGQADALDGLAVALRVLEGMTGTRPGNLWPLREDFLPTGVQPAQLDDWYTLAQDNNPDIRAQRKAYENARLEVDRNRAGHFPQVDFVATNTRGENQSIDTLNQKSSINAVGVQVNIPLFAGGRVNAQTSQAIANRERAQAELDAVINSTLVEVKRQFLAVQTGGTKVTAYQKAVDSSVVASEGTLRGMKAGIRTNSDVLDAERQMFVAKRDLAQARYQFLANTLQLKAAAGVLSEKDIVEIARLLIPVP